MKISMKGYAENSATFKTEGVVCVGHTVKMSDNFTVAPCASGDAFAGVAMNVRNEYAGIQLAGYVRFGFTGTEPTPGFCRFVADGKGGIMINENGREYLVTDVDSSDKTVGIIL